MVSKIIGMGLIVKGFRILIFVIFIIAPTIKYTALLKDNIAFLECDNTSERIISIEINSIVWLFARRELIRMIIWSSINVWINQYGPMG